MTGGWRAVAGWALAGALLVFAVISLATIGWVVMPFAVWACYRASKRYPGWRNVIPGILLGAGAVILVIAFMHLDYVPCPEHAYILLTPAERFRHHPCGGLDPMPWFRAGAATAMIGVLMYGVTRYSNRRRTIS
ncbi:MAG TPA: hypothetical protein VM099_03655 [Gemmatimonadaceae bacterium]|nr:hypothetical protein [Gemmatimonadaceae bacterium]